MVIQQAALEDMQDVIDIRVEFFHHIRSVTPRQEQELRQNLAEYFARHLKDSSHFLALLGREDGRVVSCVFVVYCDYPPNNLDSSPLRGIVMNVYTNPDYRRKGYARQLLEKAIEISREKGACLLDLFATEDGFPIYSKLGFVPQSETAMRLSFNAE